MKLMSLVLFLVPVVAEATPFDFLIDQRNIADSSTIKRQVSSSGIGTTNILMTDPFTGLPVLNKLGNSFFVNMNAIPWTLESGSDWTAVTNKPIFSTVAISGDYNDLINKPSGGSQVNSDWSASSGAAQILNKPALFSGAYTDLTGIPTTFAPAAHTQDFSTITATPTTLSGYGVTDAYPLSGNPSGFLTGVTSGQVTSALGFTPYSAANPGAFITQSGARSAISLTTTGTSGAATYNSATGVLNVPSYASTPVSINDGPSRSLVTTTASAGFQVSATRNAQVCYEGSFATTSTIGGPSSASVFLETADTNSTNPSDWATKGRQAYSNTITLAVVLNQVQANNWSICRYIPAGKYVRIRSGAITGTASVSINAEQQETLL